MNGESIHPQYLWREIMVKKARRPVRRETSLDVEKSTDPLVMSRQAGFNPDYSFVIKDLRRLGILAGSFIIVLIALTIFLH
jgi:hypothetical protein